MPLPKIEKNATLPQVRDSLSQAASNILELRSIPEDQRPEDYALQLRDNFEFILHIDRVEKVLAATEERSRLSEAKGSANLPVNQQARTLSDAILRNSDYQNA